MRIFALQSSRRLGEQVAESLACELGAHEERDFEDGEHKVRSLESVRGEDVYVLQSLHGDDRWSVNDKLCRLLFFVGSLKDAAAARVTVVAPYMCYARKDRKTKPRDPLTLRYVAALFEAVGADRIVTLDVHDLAAYQNAFRCATEHLEARKILVQRVLPLLQDRPVVLVSPDAGGIKRVNRFREVLEVSLGREVGIAFLEKHRSGGVVSGENFVGDVNGSVALVVDDMVAGGSTVGRAARSCREHGALHVWAAATHGVFAASAADVVRDPALDGLLVTDSVWPPRLDPGALDGKLEIVSVSGLIADAVRRLAADGSLVDLLEA